MKGRRDVLGRCGTDLKPEPDHDAAAKAMLFLGAAKATK